MLAYIVSRQLTQHYEKEARWERTRIVIAACVPEDKLPSVVAAIKKATDNLSFLRNGDLERALRCTIVLIFGWGLHALL